MKTKLIGYAVIDMYDEVITHHKKGELKKARSMCKQLNEGIPEKPYAVVELFREWPLEVKK